MVCLKNLYLFAATAAAASTIRARLTSQATLLISDIQNIDTAVNALTTNVQSYTSTNLVDAAAVAADVVAIHVVNRKGFADANLADPQNVNNSNAIIDFTFQSVGVDIPRSVSVLRSKKAEFAAGGLTKIVLAALELLKYDHDTFSAALLNKTAPSTEARGAQVVKLIDDSLQGGIDDFSS